MLLKYLGFLGLVVGLVACGGGGSSQPSTNNNNASISLSSSISVSSSSLSSSSASSSAQTNLSPEAKVTISTHGLTVHVDGSASIDPNNDSLSYLIDYGDGSSIRYGNAWHTYAKAGTYSIRLSVSDSKLTSDKVEIVTVSSADTNRPPVARMGSFPGLHKTGESKYQVTSYGTLSYDEDKNPLTYMGFGR
jgi:PKD repeat protein